MLQLPALSLKIKWINRLSKCGSSIASRVSVSILRKMVLPLLLQLIAEKRLTNQCGRIGYADAPWNVCGGTEFWHVASRPRSMPAARSPCFAWSPPIRVTIARAGCFAANNRNRYTQNGSMRQFTAADEISIVRDGNDNQELVMASR